LVKKRGGADSGRFYAMKTTKKSDVNSEKRIAHIKTERRVLEQIRGSPFLVSLHYALHTKKSLYLVMGECIRLQNTVTTRAGSSLDSSYSPRFGQQSIASR
jgi:serine/threonine protein kinase